MANLFTLDQHCSFSKNFKGGIHLFIISNIRRLLPLKTKRKLFLHYVNQGYFRFGRTLIQMIEFRQVPMFIVSRAARWAHGNVILTYIL